MPLTPCSLILLPYYSLLGSRMRRLPFRVRFNFPMASSICATRNIGPGWGNGWKPGGCFPWAPRHPRFHLHFVPTSSSWLNMVERWFREITDKRIRRGTFRSVPELIAAIKEYLDNHNQNPRVFVWTASVERIMSKVAKCKEALGTLHAVGLGTSLRFDDHKCVRIQV